MTKDKTVKQVKLKEGRRSTRAQYRKLKGSAIFDTQTSLQSALKKAMDQEKDGVALRKSHALRLHQTSDTLMLLNYSHGPETHFFGELAVYKPGAFSALIKQEDADVAVLPIMQQRAAEGQEYLIGLLYFMAIGNHMIVVESRVRSRSLAEYLNWFLGVEKSSVVVDPKVNLIPEIDIVLADDDPVQQAQLRLDRTKRDNIRKSSKANEDQAASSDFVGRFRAMSDRAKGVLNSLGSTDADIEKIMAKLPDSASLEVEVIVRARSLKKSESLSPTLVNDLFDASDDDEVVLRGPSGQVVGSIGRLYHEVRVKTLGDLLEPQDVERALSEAYQVFVNNDRIDPVG